MLDIGTVATRAGVRPSTLRYYEELGLVRSTGRAGGRRQYDESVLRRLKAIALAKHSGFTLAEIGDLLTSGRRLDMTRRKLDEVEAGIARAQATRSMLEAALACDCTVLDECPAVSGAC